MVWIYIFNYKMSFYVLDGPNGEPLLEKGVEKVLNENVITYND